MTLQIVHASAKPRRQMSAGAAVGLYLWLRIHRIAPMLAAAWAVLAIADYLLFAGQFHHIMHDGALNATTVFTVVACEMMVIMLPLFVVLGPIFATCILDEHLWTLPIRTHSLIGWLMLYGGGAAVVAWIINAVCILRPCGIPAPLLGPAAMLLALQGVALASRTLGDTPVQLFVASLAPITLAIGGVIAALAGVSEAVIETTSLALAPIAYALACAGAARTRRGVVWPKVFATKMREIPANESPFSSPIQAQSWFERRTEKGKRKGVTTNDRSALPGLITYANLSLWFLLTLPILTGDFTNEIWPITFLTHKTVHVYAATYWATLAPLTPLTLALFIGPYMPALTQDRRELDGSLPAFMTTRPISAVDWIAAKLRAAAANAVTIWLVQIPFILLWLMLPVQLHGSQMRLGAALGSIVTLHTVLVSLALIATLLFVTWKLLGDGLFWIMAGRSVSLQSAAVFLMLAPIFVIAYAANQPIHFFTSALISSILVITLSLKLALTAAAVTLLRRRNLLTAPQLQRILWQWSAAALFLMALLCPTLAPYGVASWQTALAILCFMPSFRLALAPLALAWERSR